MIGSFPDFHKIPPTDRCKAFERYLNRMNDEVRNLFGFPAVTFEHGPHLAFTLNISAVSGADKRRPFYVFNADGESCSVKEGQVYREFKEWDECIEHFEMSIVRTRDRFCELFSEG